MVRFHLHGSVIIYGSKAEALADCNDNQLVVRCTELPIELQIELLNELMILLIWKTERSV